MAADLPCSCYKVPGLKGAILQSGKVSYLEDRYTLGDQLGLGQFGRIRSCADMLTGETLACKSIAKGRLVSPGDLRGVLLEIEVMARLSGHPNVVDLKAVYEDEDHVHLVMELCAGGELFYRLKEHGRFPEREASVLFRHLMEVVAYCHGKGVIHRDLKPENILLATKSSSSPIKLADFGLATYIQPGRSLHGVVGSPFYIAPEVLSGGYNQAADVWSAGVILYILLSGIPPFWGKTKSRIFDAVRSAELGFPSQPWANVSENAKDLIAGMLCRDPSRRLTANQVLGHPWLREYSQEGLNSLDHPSPLNHGQGDSLVSYSLHGTCLAGARDPSFDFGSPSLAFDMRQPNAPPTTTCRSSFSAYLADTPPPCLPSASFSFCSGGGHESGACPGFSFTMPNSNGRGEEEATFALDCLRKPGRKEAATEVRRGLAAASSSRAIGVHNKRNHTIGLGEREQLDLVVSESVIRWASCIQLTSTASLRLSLVC